MTRLNLISQHLVNMENKIIEYEKKIEVLERKVSDLEKHNAGLREVLIKNVQFSAKLSNITYEMDCLLVKKGQEIRDLQELLENCPHRLTEACKSEPSPTLNDFDIDMTAEEYDEIQPVAFNLEARNLYQYVEIFTSQEVDLQKDSNGYFKCSECDYKTISSKTFEDHYRCHTSEKPFGCMFCGKRFRVKSTCITHIRGHDDSFKFKCSLCDAKFTTSQNLIKHTAKFHNGKGYERQKRLLSKRKYGQL